MEMHNDENSTRFKCYAARCFLFNFVFVQFLHFPNWMVDRQWGGKGDFLILDYFSTAQPFKTDYYKESANLIFSGFVVVHLKTNCSEWKLSKLNFLTSNV